MSANSGRALWKPYESDLGRILRARVANPTLPKSAFSLSDNEVLNPYPMPGHQISAGEWNSAEDIHPPLFFKSTRTRSICPQCLQIGYHSWLFDLDWITHCPIHSIPIEYHPPTSAIDWVDRYQTPCSRRDALFNPQRYFTVLDPLARFCHLDTTLVPVNLFNSIDGPFALTDHYCHYANELIYPHLMLALFPQQRTLVHGINLPPQKMIKVIINRHPLPDLNCFYLTSLKIHCHYIRENLRRRILWMIRSRYHTYSTEKLIRNACMANFFFDGMDVLTTAYKMWLSFLQDSKDTTRRPNHFFGVQLYTNLFGYQRPLAPTPMIGFREGKNYPCKSPSSINRQTLLPLGLTLLVYEIDCWCLFRSILQFLVTANSVLDAAPGGRILNIALINRIPRWAHPTAEYSDDIAVYLNDDRFVVLFPKSYIDPGCSDIQMEAPGVIESLNEVSVRREVISEITSGIHFPSKWMHK